MVDRLAADGRTAAGAALAGTAAGAGALGVFLLAGLAVAGWDLADFAARLTPEIALWLALAGLVAIATFAVPVAAYLRWRVVTPALVLGTVAVGWLALGAAQGLLGPETIFGLAIYAGWFAPVYLLAYVAVGGGEYLLRRRGRPRAPGSAGR